MRPFMREFVTGTPESARAMLESFPTFNPCCKVSVEETEVADLRCLAIAPRCARSEIPVVYLHGGGYAVGSPETHEALAARLAVAACRPLLLPEYRLAPEHPLPAAIEDVMKLWEALTEKHGVDAGLLSIAGDSAGGGLSLSTMLRLRDGEKNLPRNAVLLSPGVDLTASGGSIEDHELYDYLSGPLLRAFAEAYVGNGDPASPDASPLLADLHGLPPMLILVGGAEMLLDQGVKLAERLNAAGVDASLDIVAGMVHVWPAIAPFARQSKAAIRRAGQFLKLD